MKFFVLAAYVVMMIVVIAFTARKNLSLDGFLLGGRQVGSWMSALSYGASYFSAVIIVGYAGSVGWKAGTAAIWCGIGNALIGSFLAWRLLAKPTRVMGERLDVKTLPSFFEKRYNSKLLKIIASLVIFVFLIPYSASVYKGLGNMFSIAFGFDYTVVIICIALLASVYLFAGGYKATAITDFVQGIIMLFGIAAIVTYMIKAAGGVTEGINLLGTAEIGGEGYNSLFTTPSGQGVWLASIVILTSFGVLGMPQMIHKFFAIKDAASVKRATYISTFFALVVAGGVYFAGSFGRVILSKITSADGVSLLDMVKNGDLSVDMIMPSILSDTTIVMIPEFMLGLFVVLLLSASISTLTALVLSSSSVITLDLLGMIAPNMKKTTSVWTMRILCIAFVVLSLIINFLMQDTPIVSLMSLSWGTIAGAFLAPFLYGLLWRGVTKAGAFAGVIGGALISLLPPLVAGDMSVAPVSGSVALLAGLVIVPVVSKLTQGTAFSKEHIASVFDDAPVAQ